MLSNLTVPVGSGTSLFPDFSIFMGQRQTHLFTYSLPSLTFVSNFDSILGNIVEADIGGGFTPPAPPNPIGEDGER